MDFYRELEAYKKLENQIDQINAYARSLTTADAKRRTGKGNADKPDPVLQEKLMQIDGTVQLLRALQSKLRTFYTQLPNSQKKFRKLQGTDVAELKNLYQLSAESVNALIETLFPGENDRNSKQVRALVNTKETLERDRQLVNRISEKDGLSLPASVFKANAETVSGQYNNPEVQFKWPGFFEYETLYLTNKNVSHEDVLRMYIRKTPQEVRQEYMSRVSTEPRFYEYPRTRNRIDPKIRNTGNIQQIDQYLAEDDAKQNEAEKMSFRERQMLLHHKAATEKVNSIENAAAEAMQAGNELGAKPAFLRNTENAAELDVHLPSFQTSANGCWSCSGALMVGSRGMAQVTQEDIRSYRPDLSGEENVPENGVIDENYNYDNGKSLSDNADSILKHAPNSMMHTLEILPFSADNEKDGYTSATYIANAVSLLKKQINHAIRVDHSPVGFYVPGHYITITGIEGDQVMYKDSYRWRGRTEPADHTFKASLESLVAGSFFNVPPFSVEINWLSDIRLAKDNKKIHGVPSEYVYMNQDGTVTEQPSALQEATGIMFQKSLNRTGVLVTRPAEDEDQAFAAPGVNAYGSGVQMMEKVYLPKRLNADYLRTMAQKRSEADEDRLEDSDREIYHIKPGKKDPAVAEAELRRRLAALQNQAAPGHYDVAEDEPKPGRGIDTDHTDENIIDTRSEETKRKEQDQNTREKNDKKFFSNAERIKNEKLSRLNRPYLDDTRLFRPEETKSVFRQVFEKQAKEESRKKQTDRQKKQMEDQEKAYAKTLKDKYTFARIRQDANELLEDMRRHKLYLWRTNPSYKLLIGQLEQIKALAEKAVDPNRKDTFNQEDAKNLVTAIDKAAKESRKYLSDKQREMEKDPYRRNDKGRQKYEQPRIEAVLDCYNTLSELSLAMKGRENPRDILREEEERQKEFNHFLRELTSDHNYPKEAQERSIENRLYVPEKNRAELERLETLFGIRFKSIKEFSNVKAMGALASIGEGFNGIGGKKGVDRLSNKDFVALAIAASTTPDAMRDSQKNADPERRFTAAERQAYYAGETLHSALRATAENIAETVPLIQRSRVIARQAMTEYASGNREPLARLIANGIRNLTGISDSGRYTGEKNMEFFSVEMGLRMKAMLERDPKLLEKAMGYGVTSGMLKDLKNRGVEAGCGIVATRWSSEGIKSDKERWGLREKERNYVEMLLNRCLEEERRGALYDTENTEAYQLQARRIAQRREREIDEARKIQREEILEALKQTDSYRGVEKFLRQTLQETLTNGTTAEKARSEQDILKGIYAKRKDIKKQIETNIKTFEDHMIRKYEEELQGSQKEGPVGNPEVTDRSVLLTRALEKERRRIGAALPKMPKAAPGQEKDPAALKKYEEAILERQSAQEAIRRYTEDCKALRKLDEISKRYEKKKAAIDEARTIGLYTARSKQMRGTPLLDSISDAGKERELRGRLREYIRGNGYLDLPPRTFIENIVGTAQKSPGKRKLPLMIDLVCYEEKDEAVRKHGKDGLSADLGETKEIKKGKKKEDPKAGTKGGGKDSPEKNAGKNGKGKPQGKQFG